MNSHCGERVPVDNLDRECAADGCEGIASEMYPYCTGPCAEGRCPNCGEPRTTAECSP